MTSKTDKKTETFKRPPAVVVLGHVDHGKSSLLEAIKDFKITSKESGGITQHIGAYEVKMEKHHSPKATEERTITFIDTPGHEAFFAMRSRGAALADIALLVIDASQGVQAQTKEVITIIKKTDISMIVVLNKIDMPTADPEKTKRELAKADLLVESMGGQIPSVEISAKEKKGINELLEMILLVSDMQDLKADLKSPAQGIVIESYMDKLKGPVATIILERGILNSKDIIATDSAWAKIKSLQDFQGKPLESAYPSQPAIVLGFNSVPGLGEKFTFCQNTDEALGKIKKEERKKEVDVQVVEVNGDKKVLNIVLKGDYKGSIEAIEGMIKSIPQEKVALRILKAEAGEINESDVKLADLSKAQIFGFRVKISPVVLKLLNKDRKKSVRIKTFDVIYELLQEVRNSMEKSLEPEVARKNWGKLKTIAVFWTEKNRQIVGGKIIEGEFKRGLKLDILRNDEKVGSGKIINLQRDKKEVEKLSKGDEAGILFEGNIKIEKGDIVLAFVEEKKKGEL